MKQNPDTMLGSPQNMAFTFPVFHFGSVFKRDFVRFRRLIPTHVAGMKIPSLRRCGKVALIALALCFALAIWFFSRNATTIEWLEHPPSARRSRLAFLGKWSSPVRNQLLRAKFWLLGAPRSISVRGTVLQFDSPAALYPVISTPAAFSNGDAQAWIIKDVSAWLSVTNAAVRTPSKLTVSVSAGTQARIAMTDRVPIGGRSEDVGIQLDLWPSHHGRMIDLTSFVVLTEVVTNPAGPSILGATSAVVIRTNAAFGARVRLPAGSSLFLLSGQTNEHGKTLGIVISPSGSR